MRYCLKNIGGYPIYRHTYNGMIGEATAELTVTDVDYKGTMALEPAIKMYAGFAAAKTKAITANTVNITAGYTDTAGASDLYFGRLVGVANGAVTITNGSYSGNVTAAASSASNCYGGIIGCISSGNSQFTDVTVSGTISNSTSKTAQKLGGLAAVIESAAGTVELSNVTVSGLTISGSSTGSCGGLLGYGWYKSDVTVGNNSTVGVTVSNSSQVSATGGGAAGLVYGATGKWTVNNLAFNSFSVGSSPSSFGMIVNKGWINKDGIYMVLPSGYSYVIDSSVNPTGITVFDELVAYSADTGKVCRNGQVSYPFIPVQLP